MNATGSTLSNSAGRGSRRAVISLLLFVRQELIAARREPRPAGMQTRHEVAESRPSSSLWFVVPALAGIASRIVRALGPINRNGQSFVAYATKGCQSICGGSWRGSKGAFAASLCLLLCVGAFAANPNLKPNVTPILNPEKSGAELAARLRSAAPAKDSAFESERSGELEITTRDDKTTTVPFRYSVTTTPTNWLISYVAMPAGGPAETLVITHTTGGMNANSYTLKGSAQGTQSIELRGADLVRPFAGSDFWVCDLGLEFLHWPQQSVLRHEVRHSLSCWVLESITPTPVPGGYSRVRSWVAVDFEGIIHAEAYDASSTNKPVKEFLPGRIHKVDGKPLPDLKMSNLRTGQETELKFDLKKK